MLGQRPPNRFRRTPADTIAHRDSVSQQRLGNLEPRVERRCLPPIPHKCLREPRRARDHRAGALQLTPPIAEARGFAGVGRPWTA